MVAPFAMLMTFFVACALSVAGILAERKEGFWNRTLLAGVSTLELMSSHTIISVTILLIQLVEIMTLLTLVFNTHNQGSFFAILLMMGLLGCGGLFFGILVSCVCSTFMQANLLVTGISQPMTVLSGMFWPVEGMPVFLRVLSFATPTTYAGISLRNIIEKGYTISHPSVYNGYLILISWMIVCIIIGLFTLEKRKFSRNT
jgi:ABC-type multidrug transport system permease subunit